MAEETPRGQCQLSKSKEEFGDEGDKLLHENPGEVVSSLAAAAEAQRGAGSGLVKGRAVPPPLALPFTVPWGGRLGGQQGLRPESLASPTQNGLSGEGHLEGGG